MFFSPVSGINGDRTKVSRLNFVRDGKLNTAHTRSDGPSCGRCCRDGNFSEIANSSSFIFPHSRRVQTDEIDRRASGTEFPTATFFKIFRPTVFVNFGGGGRSVALLLSEQTSASRRIDRRYFFGEEFLFQTTPTRVFLLSGSRETLGITVQQYKTFRAVIVFRQSVRFSFTAQIGFAIIRSNAICPRTPKGVRENV